jgi:NADH-quinone oxidoreductase subunit L
MLLHHEHDMFKMGGLRTKLPVIYWTFLIGSASLAAIPLVTAGFYSKDQILWLAWAGEKGNIWFFLAALMGAFITSVYTFRMVFVTFFGREKTHVAHPPGKSMTAPLVVLAILATLGGFIELPHTFGHVTLFSNFLTPVLSTVEIKNEADSAEWLVQIVAAVVSLSGVYMAYFFYVKRPELPDKIKSYIPSLYQLWHSGWGFDALYNFILVRPFVFLAEINKRDIVDQIYAALVSVVNGFNLVLTFTQSGMIRWYIMGIVLGAIVILTIGLLV